MKKVVSFFAALSVTVVALTYALWGIDFEELSRLLSDAHYRALGPFLALLILFYWFKAVRWVLILYPLGRFTWMQVTPAMMIGFAGNNVLPAHLGELVRTVVFARRFAKPISGVFVSLVVERVLDVIAILLLYFGAAMIIGNPPEILRLSAWFIGGALGGIGIGIFLTLSWPKLVLSSWGKCSRWLPASIQERGRRGLQSAILGLSSLRSPKILALLLWYSLLQWGLMAAIIWLALWAFGTMVSPAVAVIVLAVVSLALTVPGAPGYVGAIQAAFVFALVPFGVAQETAFAASVFFLVAQWIPVTAIGAVFFVSAGLRMTEVRRAVEETRSTHGGT